MYYSSCVSQKQPTLLISAYNYPVRFYDAFWVNLLKCIRSTSPPPFPGNKKTSFCCSIPCSKSLASSDIFRGKTAFFLPLTHAPQQEAEGFSQEIRDGGDSRDDEICHMLPMRILMSFLQSIVKVAPDSDLMSTLMPILMSFLKLIHR